MVAERDTDDRPWDLRLVEWIARPPRRRLSSRVLAVYTGAAVGVGTITGSTGPLVYAGVGTVILIFWLGRAQMASRRRHTDP